MANLVATSSAEGRLPAAIGPMTLSEAPFAPITWVAPFQGQSASVSAALKAATGIGLPNPGEVLAWDGVKAVWAGPGQALILGAEVAPEGAAIADQSDGWIWLILDGAGAADVLARLTPIDLREDSFGVGQAARTLLFHMTATILRTGTERYEILVFRSMAATAVHDLTTAMRHVAGRTALSGGRSVPT